MMMMIVVVAVDNLLRIKRTNIEKINLPLKYEERESF